LSHQSNTSLFGCGPAAAADDLATVLQCRLCLSQGEKTIHSLIMNSFKIAFDK
jgi:hypothetical protein